MHRLRGRGPACEELGLAGDLLPLPPTCSLLPSRTPPWLRTCRPPGAGSPTRSLCPSPSSPPPAAPAPGRAARLPGDRDGKRCLNPSWSPRVAPLEKSSPCRYLLLHVVRLPGLLLDLQPVLQDLHFCLRRDKTTTAQLWQPQHPTPAGSSPPAPPRWGYGAQRCQHTSPQPRAGDWTARTQEQQFGALRRGEKPDLMPPLLLLLLLCVLLLQRPGDGRAARLQLLPQLLRLRSLPARTQTAAPNGRASPASPPLPRDAPPWPPSSTSPLPTGAWPGETSPTTPKLEAASSPRLPRGPCCQPSHLAACWLSRSFSSATSA